MGDIDNLLNDTNQKNMKEKIKTLTKEIDEELKELYDMQTVLHSLEVITNYKETGKPYPDNEMIY